MTWDPKQEKQRHFFCLGNGRRIPGPLGDAPYKPMNAAGYRLGTTPGNPGAVTAGPVGHVAELLLFNRLLTNEERKKIEDQLFGRYFNPKFDRTLHIPIPPKMGRFPRPGIRKTTPPRPLRLPSPTDSWATTMPGS